MHYKQKAKLMKQVISRVVMSPRRCNVSQKKLPKPRSRSQPTRRRSSNTRRLRISSFNIKNNTFVDILLLPLHHK